MDDHTRIDVRDSTLREAWTDLLGRYSWDCFATLTFKRRRSDAFAVVDAVRAWLYRWNEVEAMTRGLVRLSDRVVTDGYGREVGRRTKRSGPWPRKWKDGTAKPVVVVGVEPHKSGRLHAHAIIRHSSYLPDLKRTDGWWLWKGPRPRCLDCGRASIEPPTSQGDVRGYVSKYVTKGGELFLSESFDAASLPAS